jgi:hypothetical protein
MEKEVIGFFQKEVRRGKGEERVSTRPFQCKISMGERGLDVKTCLIPHLGVGADSTDLLNSFHGLRLFNHRP